MVGNKRNMGETKFTKCNNEISLAIIKTNCWRVSPLRSRHYGKDEAWRADRTEEKASDQRPRLKITEELRPRAPQLRQIFKLGVPMG